MKLDFDVIFVLNNNFWLQERTSEESKESESFKSLLHARTQEFIDEVHVHVQILYIISSSSLALDSINFVSLVIFLHGYMSN